MAKQKFNIKTFDEGVEINGHAYERGHVSYEVRNNSIMLVDQHHRRFILEYFYPFQDIQVDGEAFTEVGALTAKLRKVLFTAAADGPIPSNGPAVGIVNLTTELAVLDDVKHVAYYDAESRTIYQFFETDPGNNSGAVSGLGGVWVPWAYRELTPWGVNGGGMGVGNEDTPTTDGFINRAMFRVIAPPGSNDPLFSAVSDGPRAGGFFIVNIDFNNGSIMPEHWHRATVEGLAEAPVCAALTNRLLVSESHPRQMGVGYALFKVPNPTDFWWGQDIPADDSAILSWYSKNARLNQTNNFAQMQALTSHYLTGHGHGWFKSAMMTGTMRFSEDLDIAHQAQTFIHTGDGANVGLPDPEAVDVWGKLEFENMVLEIINLGTGPLLFDRNILLDGSDFIDQLNYMTPSNRLRIKCVAGDWYKI